MKKLERELLQTILKKYGAEEQLIQTMGECGELIAVIQNYRRAVKFGHREETFNEVLEEAVDVYMMVQQIREMQPLLFDELFDKKKKKILQKLRVEVNEKPFTI